MAKCMLFLSLAMRESDSPKPAIFPSKLSVFYCGMHYFSIEHCLSMLTGTAECTIVDAFNHAGENIVFANRSPFKNVDLGMGMEKWVMIGMGALLSGAHLISDGMLQGVSECYWFNF
ncbi:hypothetical protein CsSME_00012066 [Camellia sinensis var. sinensis]